MHGDAPGGYAGLPSAPPREPLGRRRAVRCDPAPQSRRYGALMSLRRSDSAHSLVEGSPRVGTVDVVGWMLESEASGIGARRRAGSVFSTRRTALWVAALMLVGGACTTSTDDSATPSTATTGGDLCAELDAGYDASQEPVEDWSGERMRRSADAQPERIRDAVDTFAVVIDGLQQQFADANAGPVEVTAAQWSTASNAIAWWQHANCDSRSMSWDIHDPALNPAGLTEAVPLTNDGASPQHMPSEYEALVRPDGSIELPADVEPKDQQTIAFYADVDRRCFALGEHVSAALNDATNPGAEAAHLAAATDAGERKSCISTSTPGTAEAQVRWTAEYNSWRVQVVQSDAGTPRVTGSERAWDLTEDLYVVATPPTT